MLRLFLLWMPLCLSLTWTAGLPSTSDKVELQAGKTTTQPLPRFQATTLDGRQVDSRALKGKVVVLNFWFIACKPCIMEMPELNELVETFSKDTNVVFLAPALDGPAALKPFLLEKEFRYQVIPAARTLAKETFLVNSYPTHLVADKKGNIVYRPVGYATTNKGEGGTVDLMRQKITALLKD